MLAWKASGVPERHMVRERGKKPALLLTGGKFSLGLAGIFGC